MKTKPEIWVIPTQGTKVWGKIAQPYKWYGRRMSRTKLLELLHFIHRDTVSGIEVVNPDGTTRFYPVKPPATP